MCCRIQVSLDKFHAFSNTLCQDYRRPVHTTENTFLGFVVEMHNLDKSTTAAMQNRENSVLIYGKEAYMWKGFRKQLDVRLAIEPCTSSVLTWSTHHSTIPDNSQARNNPRNSEWSQREHSIVCGQSQSTQWIVVSSLVANCERWDWTFDL